MSNEITRRDALALGASAAALAVTGANAQTSGIKAADVASLVDYLAAPLDTEADVAWVGHAPDVSQLVAELISTGPVHLRFSKGAVAAVQFDGAARPGTGQLRWLVSPRVLGC